MRSGNRQRKASACEGLPTPDLADRRQSVSWILSDDRLMRSLLRVSAGRAWAGAAIGAGIYWGFPLAVLLLTNCGLWRLYINDATHSVFTVVVVACGSALGVRFIALVPQSFRDLSAVRDHRGREVDWGEGIKAIRYHSCKLGATLFSGVAAIAGGWSLSALAVGSTPAEWWGALANGPAGIALAMSGALAAYVAAKLGCVAVSVSVGLRHVTEDGIAFRPLHPDGYYGLKPAAILVAYLYLWAVLGGIAVLIPFYSGYHGLGRSPILAFGALAYVLFAGAMTALPLQTLARTIREEKRAEIAAIEEMYLESRESTSPRASSVAHLERRNAMREAVSQIRALPELPFGFQLQAPAVAAFAFQVTLALVELARGLHIVP